MRARLRLLVRSFNEAAAEYTLARLEVAAGAPHDAAPPVLSRLLPASRADDRMPKTWSDALSHVVEVLRFIRAAGRPRSRAWSAMERAARAAAQYAQGIALVAEESRAPASGDHHP
jgi:hypothetical protein